MEGQEDYYDAIDSDNDDTTTPSDHQSTSTTTVSTTTTTKPDLSDPLYTFGRLMSLRFESNENALYLNDYGFDCIYKLSFSASSFKLNNMETLLKHDSLGAQSQPLNPLMSFMLDSHIYWIDYEEGVKTIVYKSSCVRTVYKTKEPVSLRLVHLQTPNLQQTGKSATIFQQFFSFLSTKKKNSQQHLSSFEKLLILNFFY